MDSVKDQVEKAKKDALALNKSADKAAENVR